MQNNANLYLSKKPLKRVETECDSKKVVELIENGEFKVSIVERYFAKKTAGEWARRTTT